MFTWLATIGKKYTGTNISRLKCEFKLPIRMPLHCLFLHAFRNPPGSSSQQPTWVSLCITSHWIPRTQIFVGATDSCAQDSTHLASIQGHGPKEKVVNNYKASRWSLGLFNWFCVHTGTTWGDLKPSVFQFKDANVVVQNIMKKKVFFFFTRKAQSNDDPQKVASNVTHIMWQPHCWSVANHQPGCQMVHPIPSPPSRWFCWFVEKQLRSKQHKAGMPLKFK